MTSTSTRPLLKRGAAANRPHDALRSALVHRVVQMSFQTPGRALIEYSDTLGVSNALQLFRDRVIFGSRVHLSLSNFSHVHVSSHPAVRSSQQFSVDLDSSQDDPSSELKAAEDSPEARMSFSPMIPSRTLHARQVPAHIKLIAIRNAIRQSHRKRAATGISTSAAQVTHRGCVAFVFVCSQRSFFRRVVCSS